MQKSTKYYGAEFFWLNAAAPSSVNNSYLFDKAVDAFFDWLMGNFNGHSNFGPAMVIVFIFGLAIENLLPIFARCPERDTGSSAPGPQVHCSAIHRAVLFRLWRLLREVHPPRQVSAHCHLPGLPLPVRSGALLW